MIYIVFIAFRVSNASPFITSIFLFYSFIGKSMLYFQIFTCKAPNQYVICVYHILRMGTVDTHPYVSKFALSL